MRHSSANYRPIFLGSFIYVVLSVVAGVARAQDVNKDDPQAELNSFHVADGYEVSLFASEADGIVKPVQMRWDVRVGCLCRAFRLIRSRRRSRRRTIASSCWRILSTSAGRIARPFLPAAC